jgi:hypothetical protein
MSILAYTIPGRLVLLTKEEIVHRIDDNHTTQIKVWETTQCAVACCKFFNKRLSSRFTRALLVLGLKMSLLLVGTPRKAFTIGDSVSDMDTIRIRDT